jgi:hypothetical protein
MDKIKRYQDILIEFMEEYAATPYANAPEVKNQVVADRERNHFQVVSVGWQNGRFVHDVIFHFDIVDGKVWVQQNWTEVRLEHELPRRGIALTDIIVGFVPTEMRELTAAA